MLACVSPNGRADYPIDGLLTGLLVGTVKGVHRLERTDVAEAWRAVGSSLDDFQISALVIEPQAGLVFAGTAGHGLYASTDGGQTWEPRTNGLDNQHVFAMALDERGSHPVLYAGMLPPALYRSHDLGRWWVELASLKAIPDADK